MLRSVVWQLVQGQSGATPRIYFDNNNIKRHRVAFDERYVWD
jgi:hypothetical protein